MGNRGTRRLTRVRSVLCLIGCLFTTACAGDSRPHVVLVLIDQLRADSAAAWMPGVSALAERGVVFEQARSAAPWTYPSVISLMTGLYPQQHGADGHPSKNLLSTFDPELPLLAQLLRDAGYRTAAFVANPFFHRFNPFHEGFQHFDISFVEDWGSQRVHGRQWRTARMFGDSVNQAVFSHFGGSGADAPEFTYVHYIDVHGPWKEAPFRVAPDGPSGTAQLRAAVGFVDERVVELYRHFSSRYRGNLLFFVTSDHGAALPGERRVGDGPQLRVSKKSMHDFNLRVPLMILPSDRLDAPRRIAAPVGTIDVAPTLLDWIGIPAPVAVPGRSLLPLIRGETESLGKRPLYARNDAFGLRTDALVWRGRKYVRYFDPERKRVTATRIFDLARDAGEEHGSTRPFGPAGELLTEAAGTGGLHYPATFVAADPEVLDQLRALGYLTDSEEAASE